MAAHAVPPKTPGGGPFQRLGRKHTLSLWQSAWRVLTTAGIWGPLSVWARIKLPFPHLLPHGKRRHTLLKGGKNLPIKQSRFNPPQPFASSSPQPCPAPVQMFPLSHGGGPPEQEMNGMTLPGHPSQSIELWQLGLPPDGERAQYRQ